MSAARGQGFRIQKFRVYRVWDEGLRVPDRVQGLGFRV